SPARTPPAGQGIVLGFAAALWATPVFAWIPYLLVGIAGLGFARRGARAVPAALLASSVLYAAPLALIATSAEYRYVLWSVLAALLCAVASLGSRSATAREVALSAHAE
ncbi:MAG TPA: hypothetical protein VND91_10060, partial [Candidatus Saccharimonadia bacterium]|nr:hypothetical protein [Candidatus Saccharimonadia bacterium]